MATYPTHTVEVAFGYTYTTASPTWTDVTAYVRAWSTDRGRTTQVDKFVGTATVKFSNLDRRFDPAYSSGPYYGNLKTRVPIRIRATFNAVTYDVFRGFVTGWPQSYQLGEDSICEVSCIDALGLLGGISVSTDYFSYVSTRVLTDPVAWWRCGDAGKVMVESIGSKNLTSTNVLTASSSLAPFLRSVPTVCDGDTRATRYATIDASTNTFSITGWFKTSMTGTSTTSLGCIFAEGAGYPNEPRVGIDSNGKLHYIGSDTNPGSIPDANSSVAVNDGSAHFFAITATTPDTNKVYIDGVDVTTVNTIAPGSLLGLITYAIGGKVGINPDKGFVGEVQDVQLWNYTLSATQVQQLYEAGQYGGTNITVDTALGALLDVASWPSGLRNISTTTVTCGGLTFDDLLSTAQQLENTEGGLLFVSTDGKITLRNRYYPQTNSNATTSQVTFADDNTANSIPYMTSSMPFDDEQLVNICTVTLPGATSVTAQDATSIATNGQRSANISALNDSTEDALRLAEYRVDRYKDPASRVEPFEVAPAINPSNNWPKILGLDVGYRFTMRRKPRNVGSSVAIDLLVDRISHSVVPGSWTTTISGSQADTRQYWVLGTSNLGNAADPNTRLSY